MTQPVSNRGRDAGDVVGQLAGYKLRRHLVGVEQLGVLVGLQQQTGQPLAQQIEVGIGTGVGLVLLHGHDVDVGREACPGEQQLAHLEQQQGYDRSGVLGAGDLAYGKQKALHLVGDDLRQILEIAGYARHDCGDRRCGAPKRVITHRSRASLRMLVRALPHRRTQDRRLRAVH
jgi:hypothetical protein